MRVQVADIVVRIRTVELPDECPHCGELWGQDLVTCPMVTLLQTAHTCATVGPHGLEISKEVPDPYDLEGMGKAVTWFACGYCGEPVLSGQERVLTTQPEDLERAVEETVWSKSLDRMVFGH